MAKEEILGAKDDHNNSVEVGPSKALNNRLNGLVNSHTKAGVGSVYPRVEGSIPSQLTSPHRLEAQDTALSRRRHGFESRWGHNRGRPRTRAISSGVEHLPYKEGVAGSNPASPT